MTEYTQYHHWGIIDHGIRCELNQQIFTDEHLWEFMSVDESIEYYFDETTIEHWLNKQGGFLLTDEPNPVSRMHKITLYAYHPDPKMLTWISLQLV